MGLRGGVCVVGWSREGFTEGALSRGAWANSDFLFYLPSGLRRGAKVSMAILRFTNGIRVKANATPHITNGNGRLTKRSKDPPAGRRLKGITVTSNMATIARNSRIAQAPIMPRLSRRTQRRNMDFFAFNARISPIIPATLLTREISARAVEQDSDGALRQVKSTRMSPCPLTVLVNERFPYHEGELLV